MRPCCTAQGTISNHLGFVVVVVVVVIVFRAEPVAYGGSQARGQMGAVAASLYHSQSNLGSKPSLTYTTAHGNARSLTH